MAVEDRRLTCSVALCHGRHCISAQLTYTITQCDKEESGHTGHTDFDSQDNRNPPDSWPIMSRRPVVKQKQSLFSAQLTILPTINNIALKSRWRSYLLRVFIKLFLLTIQNLIPMLPMKGCNGVKGPPWWHVTWNTPQCHTTSHETLLIQSPSEYGHFDAWIKRNWNTGGMSKRAKIKENVGGLASHSSSFQ